MIPCIVPITEDELFMPWLNYLAEVNGMDAGTFCEMFLPYGKTASYGKRLYPAFLEEVCARHGDMELFPCLFDIIEKHTLIGVMSPGMPYTVKAQMLEEILRCGWHHRKGMDRANLKMCSECRREDKARYGREIVHVLHQVPGIRVCPYHGCAMEGLEIEKKCMEQERRAAAYAKAFYASGVCYTREQMQPVFDLYLRASGLKDTELMQEAFDAGYLSHMKRYIHAFRNPETMAFDQVYRLLAYMTGTAEAFLDVIKPDGYKCRGTPDQILLEERHGIGKYQCLHCGYVFHRHGFAVEKGMLCPSCRGGLSKSEYQEKLLAGYGNGEYEYADMENRVVKHKYCGSVARLPEYFWFYPEHRCGACETKEQHWDAVLRPYGFKALRYDGKHLSLRHVCGEEFMAGEDKVRRHAAGDYGTLCPECRKIVYRANRKRKAAGI